MDVEEEIRGIKRRLDQLEETVNELVTGKGGRIQEKGMDINSFLREIGEPDSDPKRTIAFAYWMYHHKSMDKFNVKDMEACFMEARLPMPNVSDMIGKNVRADRLTKLEGEKKDGLAAYVISPQGEKYVEEGFP